MTRRKFAELTSGVGALVLGIGLGALVPQWFSQSATLIVFAGGSLMRSGGGTSIGSRRRRRWRRGPGWSPCIGSAGYCLPAL